MKKSIYFLSAIFIFLSIFTLTHLDTAHAKQQVEVADVTDPTSEGGNGNCPTGYVHYDLNDDGYEQNGECWKGNRIGNLERTAFSAYLSSAHTDKTGDGTSVSLNTTTYGFTEIFDLNDNFDSSNGKFTAPVDGVYLLGAKVYISGITSSHTSFYVDIETSNRFYRVIKVDPYNTVAGSELAVSSAAVLADMDAGDEAYLELGVSGSSKVVDINGTSTEYTHFFGHIVSADE